jgi:hypothetical protein
MESIQALRVTIASFYGAWDMEKEGHITMCFSNLPVELCEQIIINVVILATGQFSIPRSSPRSHHLLHPKL